MLRKLRLRKLIALFIFLGRSLIPCHFYIFRAASGCWSFYMYILFFNVLKLKVKRTTCVSYITMAGELELNFCKFLKSDRCVQT